MLLLLLLLTSTEAGQAQRVPGLKKGDACQCKVNSTAWSFPALKYETILQEVQTCEDSLSSLQEQLKVSVQRLPQIQAQVENMTARLQPFQYLHHKGLYSVLSLRLLGQELSRLEADISTIHSQMNNAQTQKLSKEMSKLRTTVERMKVSDTVNMKTVRESLRKLKNSVESCKTIPKDFRGQHSHCLRGLITSISEPVTTKVSPFGKSYTLGSWGKQAQMNSEGQKSSYWVQPLDNSNAYGNTLRLYQTYTDFIASVNHEDFTLEPAPVYPYYTYTYTNMNEGPNAVLYGEALYYHCYYSANVCRFDLRTKTVQRVTLPGTGVGFNNKFPYCYYDCLSYSDVDLEADETGLWVLYATMGNHGNLVVSRLVWDNDAKALNVSQTWETRLFKKSVSNAFMVCGVLYATRYVDEYQEEVFYAFDTASGKEDNTLSLMMQKIAKGVASLSYNPLDRQIYMYNDGYLLTYQTQF